VRFNRACEELTGYVQEEVSGTPFWEFLVAPERVEGLRQMLVDMVQHASTARHEGEWLTRSGERRLIDWSNAPLLDEAGKPRYIVATGIDITERKQAEQALLQANEDLKETITTLTETQAQLVQADKMASLGSLVAGISHEINTPIGIGVTSATTLQEEVSQLQRQFNEGSMKRSNLERFLGQAEQGLDILTRNLLRAADLIRSFKRVAVDQSSDQWRRLDLREYVDEILTSLRPRWKHTPIQVFNEVEEDILLYTHPGALYQIISNLVMNSLTHAYEPEQAGRLRISGRISGGRLYLEYSDDGKGIPLEFQNRVFDPFFTTRRGAGGSGLGMHIVYNLVTGTLKGSIVLASHPGEGTTFRMALPLLKEESQ
jgi:PAS domain S-box-containing protein